MNRRRLAMSAAQAQGLALPDESVVGIRAPWAAVTAILAAQDWRGNGRKAI
jgi:hypothetical protein